MVSAPPAHVLSCHVQSRERPSKDFENYIKVIHETLWILCISIESE